MMIALITACFTLSLACNAYLWRQLKQKSQRKESYEASELLRDLLGGTALVKVTRVAPADVLIRSPRDAG